MAILLEADTVSYGNRFVVLEAGVVLIGSLHTNQLPIDSEGMEPIHAAVSTQTVDGKLQLLLTALAKERPTHLNGERVEGSRELRPGDVIRFGKVAVRVLEVTQEELRAKMGGNQNDATVFGDPSSGAAQFGAGGDSSDGAGTEQFGNDRDQSEIVPPIHHLPPVPGIPELESDDDGAGAGKSGWRRSGAPRKVEESVSRMADLVRRAIERNKPLAFDEDDVAPRSAAPVLNEGNPDELVEDAIADPLPEEEALFAKKIAELMAESEAIAEALSAKAKRERALAEDEAAQAESATATVRSGQADGGDAATRLSTGAVGPYASPALEVQRTEPAAARDVGHGQGQSPGGPRTRNKGGTPPRSRIVDASRQMIDRARAIRHKVTSRVQMAPGRNAARARNFRPHATRGGNTLELVALWGKAMLDFRIFGGPRAREGEQERGNIVVLGSLHEDTVIGNVRVPTPLALVRGLQTAIELRPGMQARAMGAQGTADFQGPAQFVLQPGQMAIVKHGPFDYWLRYVQLPNPRLQNFSDVDGRPTIFIYAAILYAGLAVIMIKVADPDRKKLHDDTPWAERAAKPTIVLTTPKPTPVPTRPPEKPKVAEPEPPKPPPVAPKPAAAKPAPPAKKVAQKKPEPPPPPPKKQPPPPPPPKSKANVAGLNLDKPKAAGAGKVSNRTGAGAISVNKTRSEGGKGFAVNPDVRNKKFATAGEDPVLKGTMDKNDITSVIAANMARFQACFEQHVKSRSPRWRVMTAWVVTQSGGPQQARVESSSFSSRPGEGCIVGVLNSLSFPAPKGGNARVRYPFDFGPSPKQAKEEQQAKAVASSLDFLSDSPNKSSSAAPSAPTRKGASSSAPVSGIGLGAKALSAGSGSELSKAASGGGAVDGAISTGARGGSKDGVLGGQVGGTGKSMNKVLGRVALGGGGGGGGGGGIGRPGLEVSGTGSLSDAEIEKALARYQSQFQYCYEKALLSNPNLAGNMVLGWTISPAGRVADARVVSSQLNHSGLHGCLAGVVQKVSFPAPKGGEVKVKYPFAFSSTAL